MNSTSTASAQALIPVSFRNATLSLIEHNGQPYVPMKSVVAGMGLDWSAQASKLRINPRFSVVEITTQVSGDDQRRAMVCMPLRKLPGWLTSIHPNKVRPELRATIIAYQNECDDVLWHHWNQSRPIAPPKPAAEPERLRVRADFPFNPPGTERDHKAADLSLHLLKIAVELYVDDRRGREAMLEYCTHIEQCLVRCLTEVTEAQTLLHVAGTYLKRWKGVKS